MSELSHLDASGRAHMVDVSAKPETARTAKARGRLACAQATLDLVREGRTPKGAVISTAELAGIMAAKQTAGLIPLCHPLPLSQVVVRIAMNTDLPGFDIESEVRTTGRTGVEMEALTAVSVAALTLYDMLKAVDKAMRIEGVEVVLKTGGKSDWGAAG
ncbi:cyclic pyranopterin monophosphate synthase MoaC [Asticcacaulis sp. EMRT-3]|uniref:cyclic pyranopterin monophosphate synthase MoaC n=1 Tax=Asticcacaulis sp. EMRT-3 TaxID=3040349 RepID=UPI0024AF5FCC|nr:cyclic pyranopterin monophosphate synthase MoaC [Asticcacaulis sp. EMRT-3]MDI7773947.1 cyclic pyranopterin monophosphate synthase MoaC [Asticcacaulis sp. EMRT-3]